MAYMTVGMLIEYYGANFRKFANGESLPFAALLEDVEEDLLDSRPEAKEDIKEAFEELRRSAAIIEESFNDRTRDYLRLTVETNVWQMRAYEARLVMFRMTGKVEMEQECLREMARLDAFFVEVAEAVDRYPEFSELTAVYAQA